MAGIQNLGTRAPAAPKTIYSRGYYTGMGRGVLDSFLTTAEGEPRSAIVSENEDHKKNSETTKTPLTKKQEESIISNDLRNTNKILKVIEEHLAVLAFATMLSMAILAIVFLVMLVRFF